MSKDRKLKIVVVTAFYSEGMGYSENCLPRALARLGHDVHVFVSTFNVYGNEPLYDATYRAFLGPAQVAPGDRIVDGYTLHRLESRLVSGYVDLKGLLPAIQRLGPDIVHSLEIGSLQTFEIAALKPFAGFKLFTETHQTLSVIRPYMLDPKGDALKRSIYRLTRTLPGALASTAMELCYAVTPDCGEVARRFYGVPERKIRLLSLGSETVIFHPVESGDDARERATTRQALGYADGDIVVVYTGRFTSAKNPLVLAQAIDRLSEIDPRYQGLFIGDGEQRADIAACRNVRIVPFMTHNDLARHYRAVDLGAWPRQESMSMLDAASSGVPLIVSDRIGEPGRVEGNGRMYRENDVDSMIEVLRGLADPAQRQALGRRGREKMLAGFSWGKFAERVEADYYAALGMNGGSA